MTFSPHGKRIAINRTNPQTMGLKATSQQPGSEFAIEFAGYESGEYNADSQCQRSPSCALICREAKSSGVQLALKSKM